MKTLALLFALSLFLLANPTYSTFNPIRLPTADEAVGSDSAVLDIDGDEIQPGGEYYVTSVIWGAGGGGVRLARMDPRGQCPSDVIVSPNSLDFGNPVTFTPADPNATVVMPSTYQSFSFNAATNKLCQDKQSWEVQYDRGSGQYFLKAGEFVSNLSDQFKIELVESNLNAYKMTYCQFGTDKCYNVGRYFDRSSSRTRLALSNSPFVVVFKKASV